MLWFNKACLVLSKHYTFISFPVIFFFFWRGLQITNIITDSGSNLINAYTKAPSGVGMQWDTFALLTNDVFYLAVTLAAVYPRNDLMRRESKGP